MRRKVKVYNPNKVDLNLFDPMGFTIFNNPHPLEDYLVDEYDYKCYHEWDEYGVEPVVCHNCLLRAKIGSGNCVDGGEYFAPCIDKKLKLLEERGKGKPKVTYQSTLF